jgi:hypothetical protein
MSQFCPAVVYQMDGAEHHSREGTREWVLGHLIASKNSTILAAGLNFWFADADLDVQY